MITRRYKETEADFNQYVLERVLEKDFDSLNLIYTKTEEGFFLPAGYLGGKGAEHGIKYILCNVKPLAGAYTLKDEIVMMTYQENSCSLMFKSNEDTGRMFQTVCIILGPCLELDRTEDPVGKALANFKSARR